jgi:hypothetical protein
MTLPLPSESNVYDSLDERVACDHFAGKTLAEAAAMIAEHPSRYLEDLMHMGPVAFLFYVRAATQQLLAAPDSDFVMSFVGLVEQRVEFDSAVITPIAKHLLEVCEHILAHAEEFGIRKSSAQIQDEVAGIASVLDETSARLPNDEEFDWVRFVDVERRYAEVRESLRKIDQASSPHRTQSPPSE